PKTIKKSDFLSLGRLWIEEGGKYLYIIIIKGTGK
ncbi:unnamed protein product, partial [marine sediment metagenome]